ncbi:MAG: TolC family protein [Armatimonadetes bacterium]|nr:TolC family protein [Armatimonadota bacterium]
MLVALGLVAGPARAQASAPPAPMTLEESVRYALEHHPDMRLGEAQVRLASQFLKQRLGEQRPNFGLSGVFLRQGPTLPSFQPGGAPIIPGQRYNASLAFRQPVFDSGLREANEKSARIGVSAQNEVLSQLRDDITLDVSTAYYNVLRAQSLLQVADARLASAREQLRVAEARFKADVAPRFDVVRAETEVRNAETDVIAARNGVELAEASFNYSLGREVTTPVQLAPAAAAPAVDILLSVALQTAMQHRPRLRERSHRLDAARQDVRAARAANRPSVDWVAEYDRRSSTGFSPNWGWNMGVSLSFPFFDSGITRSRVHQAQERAEEERAQGERDQQRVELQVRQALLNLGNARERLASAQQELVLAQESLRIANVRYNAGVGTTVEVTDAQLAMARAATNVANGKFDILVAIAQLEYATGTPVAEMQARAAGTGGPTPTAPAGAAPPRDLEKDSRKG